MRFRFAVAGLMLVSVSSVGCSDGPTIPPSKGGAAARDAVEYPLGPPPAPKNAKAKKPADKKAAPANTEIVR